MPPEFLHRARRLWSLTNTENLTEGELERLATGKLPGSAPEPEPTAAAFPRELLYPTIAERVWAALARGDYADTEIGVDLMRKAFDPEKGRLRSQSGPKPEREALAHLFAGAIGSYK